MQDKVITIDIGRRNDPQSLLIGREASCQYRLEDDEYASLRHAKISMNSMGVVFVEDLGSTNGTSFNGTKVWDRMLVPPPGGVLRVGHTDIEIRLVDDWLSRVTRDSMHKPND